MLKSLTLIFHKLFTFKAKDMKFKYVLGVDVSKEKLNLCLLNEHIDIIDEWEIENTKEKIEVFLSISLAEYCIELSDLIVLMEHTGTYIQHLTSTCIAYQLAVCVEHANNITEHISAKNYVEEKNDPLDARRIAEYGIRFQDKLKLYEPSSETIILIKRLSAQRNRLLKSLNILIVPLQESIQFDKKAICQQLAANQNPAVKALKKAIKEVDQQIDQSIKDDDHLKQIYKVIKSVDGVGPVTAREFIVKTEGFTKFKPNQAKSFSRYNAMVPVTKQSGKKKGKARIPKRKNNSMKALLTMGAISVINTKSDLAKYYDRKINEGKEHLVVINNMRNKIILRVFAVVRDNVMYDRNFKLSTN